MSTKIYIVAHKKFIKPACNAYVPIKVGKGDFIFENGLRDNVDDNISQQNDTFCEMTAIYWIWKNIRLEEDDVIGISHYRRYFRGSEKSTPIDEVDIENILSEYDLILPKKRNYYITTVRSHYIKAHFEHDLALLEEIINRDHVEYSKALSLLMNSKKICLYNMFITTGKYFESYCKWAFPILFELEKRIDRSAYDSYQNRVIGFLAERLFNIWVIKNEQLKIKFVPVYNSEGESFLKKGYSFIKRQYLGK